MSPPLHSKMPSKDTLHKKYTWQQLAEHNKPGDAWVAIQGEVFDVTDWVKKHPGGQDVVLWAAGRDATQLFESYHEDIGKAKAVLKKYQIGLLADNELPVFPPRGEFFCVLKERIRQYFKETNQDPKFHPLMLVRYALVFGTLLGSYYLQYYNTIVSSNIALQFFFAVTMGFACAQIGLLPMHDASHCAFTRNPWVWRILGASHDFFNGCSFLNWCYQHMLGHHPYTNIAEADPDITTNDPDFRRIKPSQAWYKRYIHQQWFVPVLYGALATKTRIQDVMIQFVEGANDHIRCNPVSPWHMAMFWGGKAFFLFYRFILPLTLTSISFGRFAALFVVQDLVASYWLALTFQANHVVDDVEWPLPNEKKEVDMDWAVLQVVTAQDYAHQSFFWTNFAGALNYQVVHHLFPNILQHYYPEIVPIVKQTCQEYKVKYIIKDTYKEAILAHFNHLKVLGDGPDGQQEKKLR